MRGLVALQVLGKAAQSAGGGLAGDARVHHAPGRCGALERLPRRRTQPCEGDEAVGGREAVAEHHDGAGGARRRRRPRRRAKRQRTGREGMNAQSESERQEAAQAAKGTSVIVKAEGLTKQVTTPDHVLIIVRNATSRCARARRSRSSAPRVRASPPCWDCSRASTFPPRARSGSTARISSRWTRTAARACAGAWWASSSSPSSSCRRSPRWRT